MPTTKDWAQAIQTLKPEHNLDMLLQIKGMARATYYYSLKTRKDKHASLRKSIERIFNENNGSYGYRRVYQQLRTEGYTINHKTVAKLMAEMGLQARRKKVRYRSYKGEVGRIAPNLLERNFQTDGPNRKWVTDITQIDIRGRKCYLSPILDVWNGEIISYAISDSPNLKLVTSMLQKALRKQKSLEGMLMHSDQGWHYQHIQYRQLLKDHGIVQSMSRRGNCLDNAIMENFFGLMKNELLYPNQWESLDEFKSALKQYIHYYNNKRIKLKLKMSPVQYRTHFQNIVN